MDQKQHAITSLGTDGRGIARGDSGVIFVKNALPQEYVSIKITHTHKNYSEAQMVDYRAPSPERVSPPCPFFGPCGGCSLQHLSPQKQTEWKAKWFFETLTRIGRWDEREKQQAQELLSLFFLVKEGYRRRLKLHFDGKKLGLKSFHSNDIIPIHNCLIAHPKITELIPLLQKALLSPEWQKGSSKKAFEIECTFDEGSEKVSITLMSKDKDVSPQLQNAFQQILQREKIPLYFGDKIELKTPFLEHFTTSKTSFVQPHKDCLSSYSFFIFNNILRFLDTFPQESQNKLLSWDLFCGSGLFTKIPYLAGLKKGFSITTLGIEGANEAIRSLQQNYRSCPSVQGKCEDVHRFLKNFRKEQKAPDIILLDPPRAGLGLESTKKLIEICGEKSLIIYIACDPASFARDSNLLLKNHFELVDLGLFDSFGHTTHYEVIGCFQRG